ncbi:long-chain acyl-CoA synthetase [Paragonimus westermani]|uniref:Long-chain acyl-CoA synthetase n=1 Tax=Paragonimus westermani TaxID=34504 RepID=A0A5J4NS19_9TREM|nr:long-chain acyl-CoA synthetase [Paragonimus westermani]
MQVVQIYGTAETMGLVSDVISPEIASHNAIANGIQVKLSDRPDLGLLITRDKIGEILVRGPRCTEGYYKDVESTRRLFEDEGWQHTGDLGQWASVIVTLEGLFANTFLLNLHLKETTAIYEHSLSNGSLLVLDRCANAIKLNPDDYLWFDKVQGIYQCCPLICNVYVDRSHSRLFNIAFVHPDFSVLRAELFNPNVRKRPSSTRSVPNDQTNESLCLDIHVRKYILKRLNTLGKKRGLKGFEMAGSIYLCPNPFTCENGLLTPLLQLARHRARIIFHDVIQTLSREGELII